MAVPILTAASTILCPHGGTVSASPGQSTATAEGSPLLLLTDVTTVAGCPFQVPAGPSTKPQPCTTVRWTTGATQTKVNGTPVLLQTSAGAALCLSAEQIPQGPPTVAAVQQQAMGT